MATKNIINVWFSNNNVVYAEDAEGFVYGYCHQTLTSKQVKTLVENVAKAKVINLRYWVEVTDSLNFSSQATDEMLSEASSMAEEEAEAKLRFHGNSFELFNV